MEVCWSNCGLSIKFWFVWLGSVGKNFKKWPPSNSERVIVNLKAKSWLQYELYAAPSFRWKKTSKRLMVTDTAHKRRAVSTTIDHLPKVAAEAEWKRGFKRKAGRSCWFWFRGRVPAVPVGAVYSEVMIDVFLRNTAGRVSRSTCTFCWWSSFLGLLISSLYTKNVAYANHVDLYVDPDIYTRPSRTSPSFPLLKSVLWSKLQKLEGV